MKLNVDSTVLCYKAVADGLEVHALTIIYGQRHVKEIESAKKTAGLLGISHRVVDLSNINELLQGSALTDSSVDVPEVPETTEHFETLKTTIVPNRNAIFLSVAIGYSESIKADNVFFGAHHSDRGVYPDCRKEFVEAFEKAVSRIPDVLECHLTAGTADYILKIVAEDTEDFARIHRQYLTRLPGVAKMQSSFALRTVVNTTALPV